MATERFKKWLLALVALFGVTVLPMSAEEDAGTAPYSIELTHNGGAYKVRFTIEGADSIKAAGQGTGADYIPWIKIHDFPSSGVCARIRGRTTGRIHHLLSRNESAYF